MPVPRNVWLQTCVVMLAALARRRTIAQASFRWSRSPLSCASLIRATFDGLEQGDPSGVRELGTLKVFGEVALQRVVAGHFVEFAAFFVESHPQPPLLVEDVGHVHAAGRGHAGKGEHHDPDQGPVAQPQHVRTVPALTQSKAACQRKCKLVHARCCLCSLWLMALRPARSVARQPTLLLSQ